MALVQLECSVTTKNSGRIDRVVQQLTGRSRGEVRGLLDAGCVTLNGDACSEAGTPVASGDLVQVRHDPHRRYREKPRPRQSRGFRLVYEDEYLIVVDKAAAVLTVPTDHRERNTLLEAVNRYLERTRKRAWVVHRLDRGTSGLLVFGKERRIAEQLQQQFRRRKPEREYAAIVAGKVEAPEGKFDTRLGTTSSLQRYSTNVPDKGERAVTMYRVERHVRGATFVRVWLETGRRNQIRVHFAEAGHPVLGDERYRPDFAQHGAWRARRLALHARRLGFTHPVTQAELSFESPLPAEFERFLGSPGGRSRPPERG